VARGNSCNVFLVDGGSELALIDAGMPDSVADMLQNISRLGLDPKKLRKLFMTHAHWDHCAGAEEWRKAAPLEIYGHAICRETMQGPGNSGIYDREYHPPVHIPSAVDHVLKHGDAVTVGDTRLSVIELPGHTPDGLGYLIELNGGTGCFTGDTAIGDQGGVKGVIGWIDGHWKSCLSDSKHSLTLLQSLQLRAIFPGHGVAHVTPAAVQTSLENCHWRLKQFAEIPDLGTMIYVKM
jgi:hydroxyacylglutathione hydrolase